MQSTPPRGKGKEQKSIAPQRHSSVTHRSGVAKHCTATHSLAQQRQSEAKAMRRTATPRRATATTNQGGGNSPHHTRGIMKQSPLERTFETLWRTLNGPELQTEYHFHQTRKWRFDFADPLAMVAIELEGGTWSNGRHNRAAGFTGDCAKYNAANLAGWQVFRFTADMLANDPYSHLLPVAEYISRKHHGIMGML